VNIEEIETQVTNRLVDGLTTYDANRDRSRQSAEGRLGMSDLGFCRNKALLKLTGAPTDEPDEPETGPEVPNWPANVGTAVHSWIDEAFRDETDVLIGEQIGRVTAEFDAASISGTPDLVLPEYNLLLDVKTKNRIEPARREGHSQNWVFQRHAYALGCVAKGLLRDDGTLLVGNAVFDRSGKDKRPWVQIVSFDPTLTAQVNMWIEDVLYAYEHNEEAMKDVPVGMCPHVCDFFTTCRGGVMEDTHDPTLITNPEEVNAVQMYLEGQKLAREGKNLQSIAKPILTGVNGATPDGVQVRWTRVQAPEFTRSAYDKIEVRKIKR